MWTEASCHPDDERRTKEATGFLEKAVGHNPSARCSAEYGEAWCKLQRGTLMPTLTPHPDQQCVEPEGYKSKRDHPKFGQPARIAFVINAYQAGMYQQIIRLFNSIYDEKHVYLFHIDGRSKLLRPSKRG